MQVILDKQDLMSLVKGNHPSYELMNHFLIKDMGTYSDSYGRWDWNYNKLRDLNEEVLWDIYQRCKQSWK